MNAAAALLQRTFNGRPAGLVTGALTEVLPAERQLLAGQAASGVAFLDSSGKRGSYGETFIWMESCEDKEFVRRSFVSCRGP